MSEREAIREAIHRVICDVHSSHDPSLGRCSVAADAVAMDRAARAGVPAEPPPNKRPDIDGPTCWTCGQPCGHLYDTPVPRPAPEPLDALLRAAAEKAVHLVGNYLWNEDGEDENWLIEAYDDLKVALAPTDPNPQETSE